MASVSMAVARSGSVLALAAAPAIFCRLPVSVLGSDLADLFAQLCLANLGILQLLGKLLDLHGLLLHLGILLLGLGSMLLSELLGLSDLVCA